MAKEGEAGALSARGTEKGSSAVVQSKDQTTQTTDSKCDTFAGNMPGRSGTRNLDTCEFTESSWPRRSSWQASQDMTVQAKLRDRQKSIFVSTKFIRTFVCVTLLRFAWDQIFGLSTRLKKLKKFPSQFSVYHCITATILVQTNKSRDRERKELMFGSFCAKLLHHTQSNYRSGRLRRKTHRLLSASDGLPFDGSQRNEAAPACGLRGIATIRSSSNLTSDRSARHNQLCYIFATVLGIQTLSSPQSGLSLLEDCSQINSWKLSRVEESPCTCVKWTACFHNVSPVCFVFVRISESNEVCMLSPEPGLCGKVVRCTNFSIKNEFRTLQRKQGLLLLRLPLTRFFPSKHLSMHKWKHGGFCGQEPSAPNNVVWVAQLRLWNRSVKLCRILSCYQGVRLNKQTDDAVTDSLKWPQILFWFDSESNQRCFSLNQELCETNKEGNLSTEWLPGALWTPEVNKQVGNFWPRPHRTCQPNLRQSSIANTGEETAGWVSQLSSLKEGRTACWFARQRVCFNREQSQRLQKAFCLREAWGALVCRDGALEYSKLLPDT